MIIGTNIDCEEHELSCAELETIAGGFFGVGIIIGGVGGAIGRLFPPTTTGSNPFGSLDVILRIPHGTAIPSFFGRLKPFELSANGATSGLAGLDVRWCGALAKGTFP